jgi:hypothetical protein
MSSKSTEVKDIEEITRQAHCGEDVSEHFTGSFQAKQRISVVLPLELLQSIEAECDRQKVTLQDWIEKVFAEKISEF